MSEYVPQEKKPFMAFILKEFKITCEGGLIAKGRFDLVSFIKNPDAPTADRTDNLEYYLHIERMTAEDVDWEVPAAAMPPNVNYYDINATQVLAIITALFTRTPVALIPPAPFETGNMPPHKRRALYTVQKKVIDAAFNNEIREGGI